MATNTRKRNRAVLFVSAAIFTAAMAFFAWDLARHTTWRGSKGQLKERIIESAAQKK